MKTKQHSLIAALCLATALARAEFNIDWWRIGGSAGQSTGGVWTVTGSLESAAGTASSGSFTLTGGYLSVIGAANEPGSPRLTIERQGANLRISWSRAAGSYVLQETPTLTGSPTIPWTPSAYARSTNTAEIFVIISMPPGNRYFRLHRP